jgi:hypothetical protein
VSTCAFCKGQPVMNAASWVDDDGPRWSRCPRCGELNLPDLPKLVIEDELDEHEGREAS